MPRRVWVLAGLLAAGTASAREDDQGVTPLEGVGRMTLQAGWRLASQNTFYESFYSLPDYRGLDDGRRSPGGPLLVGSFGYGITDNIELGIDLFATGEQLKLVNAPTNTNLIYGALISVRFQTVLDVLTDEGVIPFIGIQSGPTLAFSQAPGVKGREVPTQMYAGSLGATFRFTPRWALTAEYRLSFARGQSAFGNMDAFKGLASYNAGGNWFSLGVTYLWPSNPSRPLPTGL